MKIQPCPWLKESTNGLKIATNCAKWGLLYNGKVNRPIWRNLDQSHQRQERFMFKSFNLSFLWFTSCNHSVRGTSLNHILLSHPPNILHIYVLYTSRSLNVVNLYVINSDNISSTIVNTSTWKVPAQTMQEFLHIVNKLNAMNSTVTKFSKTL